MSSSMPSSGDPRSPHQDPSAIDARHIGSGASGSSSTLTGSNHPIGSHALPISSNDSNSSVIDNNCVPIEKSMPPGDSHAEISRSSKSSSSTSLTVPVRKETTSAPLTKCSMQLPSPLLLAQTAQAGTQLHTTASTLATSASTAAAPSVTTTGTAHTSCTATALPFSSMVPSEPSSTLADQPAFRVPGTKLLPTGGQDWDAATSPELLLAMLRARAKMIDSMLSKRSADLMLQRSIGSRNNTPPGSPKHNSTLAGCSSASNNARLKVALKNGARAGGILPSAGASASLEEVMKGVLSAYPTVAADVACLAASRPPSLAGNDGGRGADVLTGASTYAGGNGGNGDSAQDVGRAQGGA